MITVHLTAGQAAILALITLIAIPCVIHCTVQFLGEELQDFRRRHDVPEPHHTAVRGGQTLDAFGHYRVPR